MAMLIHRDFIKANLLIIWIVGFYGCMDSTIVENQVGEGPLKRGRKAFEPNPHGQEHVGIRALLTTRFADFDQFKQRVNIRYDRACLWTLDGPKQREMVHLEYQEGDELIQRTLTSGIGQGALLKLMDADPWQKMHFLLENPLAVRERKVLDKFHMLSRRRADVYGSKDVAFYDLAETMVRHINTPEVAFQTFRDSLEKGYISTFNHLAAQAIITAFFSEDLADLIGDLHERHTMPELTTGQFSEKQLTDTITSPMDNYVDVLNNEIGQRLGLKLKRRYQLHELTHCTPELLATLLNEIQAYCMWALEIGMDPFQARDAVVIKFARKMNVHLASI